jgi:hypothetical protein
MYRAKCAMPGRTDRRAYAPSAWASRFAGRVWKYGADGRSAARPGGIVSSNCARVAAGKHAYGSQSNDAKS